MIKYIVTVALVLGVASVAFPSAVAAVAVVAVCALAVLIHALNLWDANQQRADDAFVADFRAMQAKVEAQAAELKAVSDTVARHKLLIKQ